MASENLPILTVSQLTQAIKICIETRFTIVWLQGEVSNCKLHSSGHLYFSLKDAAAQIAAVMYRSEVSALKSIPKDGAQVLVRGEINVYAPGGKYQILVKELRLVGIGELLLKLEELKTKLLKKGYFKQERKKPLPKFPRTLGVVTSPTGAAIQDILHILTRRTSGFHLILNPVRVQGEGAAQEIAQAIQQFNDYQLVDVMIVGRGGGSMEDLWPFNEEIVAEAIFHSRIPIISAVGHEIDHCIADYVADVRAPTPSAAAEIATAEKAHQLQHLAQLKQRMQQTLRHHLRHYRQRLESSKRHPLLLSPYGILGTWMQKLDDVRQQLDFACKQQIERRKSRLETRHKQAQALRPTAQIRHMHHKLTALERSIQEKIANRIQEARKKVELIPSLLLSSWNRQQYNRRKHFQTEQKQKQLHQLWDRIRFLKKERLEKISASLDSIDPKNLLTKGYSILFAEKRGSVITSVRDLEKKQAIRILLSDGEALTTVMSIYPYE